MSNSCHKLHNRRLVVRAQKTDTRGLQKLLINTGDEYTKPQTEQRILEQRRRGGHCCWSLVTRMCRVEENKWSDRKGASEKGARRKATRDREKTKKKEVENTPGRARKCESVDFPLRCVCVYICIIRSLFALLLCPLSRAMENV